MNQVPGLPGAVVIHRPDTGAPAGNPSRRTDAVTAAEW